MRKSVLYVPGILCVCCGPRHSQQGSTPDTWDSTSLVPVNAPPSLARDSPVSRDPPTAGGGALVAMSGNLVSALHTEILIPLYEYPNTECEV